MPGYNECGIYDPSCVKGTCEHPTNPRNSGMQCRTRPEQRPCGSAACVRPECSRARLSASAFQAGMMIDTTSGTNIGAVPSESAQEFTGEGKRTYDLTGLSEKDMETLARALTVYRDRAPVGMEYRTVDNLRGKVTDTWFAPE